MNADRVLIQDNIGLLAQAEALIHRLSDRVYADASAPPFKSGVGTHIRHILDFYNAFFARADDRVDYDRRERAPAIETDRPSAIAAIRAVAEALTDVPDFRTAVMSKNDDGSGDPGVVFHGSSIGREMQFLASHTVHHYAMIAMVLTHHGISPPPDFGVAPSTRAHWRATGRLA